ncbi:MAG: hypothetical protein NTW87_15655 [Planctomycetota bacterium]|nr:hypothetical protein [Planctomycetota bacterium]
MTRMQAVPSLPLVEALRRLDETGEPVILQGADGKECAALVSLADLQRLAAVRVSARPPAAPLAPDGLPWPEGYFERTPVVPLEEATRRFGVRPRRYCHGRPVYTDEDARNPAYKWPYPAEPEWEEDLKTDAGTATRESTTP